MPHLSTERLAALVDEPPAPAELAHLAACAACARERDAYARLVEHAATESARIGTPLTTWDSLAPALAADGIMNGSVISEHAVERDAAAVQARPRRRVAWRRTTAAVLLLGTGGVAGRLSAIVAAGRGSAATTASASGPLARSDSALADAADSVARFASVDDARAAQARAQFVYQSATAYLAARDSSVEPIDSPAAMRARLAALDRAHEVMGEALTAAPYDPVINSYYLNTAGQREATIRQLNTVLPASMRIMSY